MEINQESSLEQTDVAASNLSWQSTQSLEDVDVLVVGFGPVGAAIANLLGRYGVRTLVVDKEHEIFMAPRAIALDNEALRILQLAGLSEDAFEKIAIPYVRMRSPYAGEFGRVNSVGSIDGHPKLVTFYQPDLERALREKLALYSRVTVMPGTTLTTFVEDASGIVAHLEINGNKKAVVRARYLIGADGANSLVRQLIGQEFKGETFAEDWLIVDAQKVPNPIDHIEFICDPKRPIPHMVAPGNRERWEFMLQPGESRQEMESDARISELLAPWGSSKEMVIERKAVYRFHARAVSAFSKGRAFLAGDAAHITPPFVGQGLVAGLRDAANLCWKLAWVVHGHASPQILNTYDHERRPHAKSMINLAKFMGKLVMPRNAPIAILSHGFMRLLRLVPQLRAHFDDQGIKPKNQFSNGLFIKGRTQSKLIRGALLVQGWLRDADGHVLLSDDILRPALTLIGFGIDATTALDQETALDFAGAGGEVVQITHRGQKLHLKNKQHWEDLEGVFLPGVAPYGWAVVVRPDRTIVHDGPISEVNRLVRETLALLGTPTEAPITSVRAAARAA